MDYRLKLIAYFLICAAFYYFVTHSVDPFLLTALTTLSLYFALLCLIFAVIFIGHEWVTGRRTQRPHLALVIGILGLIATLWLAVPSNAFYAIRAEADAKAYPEKIAPLLESYRAAHGSYPASLGDLPDRPPIPRLLRRSYSYRSDGHTYYFSFPKPGGLIDTWEYNSKYHAWYLST